MSFHADATIIRIHLTGDADSFGTNFSEVSALRLCRSIRQFLIYSTFVLVSGHGVFNTN